MGGHSIRKPRKAREAAVWANCFAGVENEGDVVAAGFVCLGRC
jgi:hypothetical protein